MSWEENWPSSRFRCRCAFWISASPVCWFNPAKRRKKALVVVYVLIWRASRLRQRSKSAESRKDKADKAIKSARDSWISPTNNNKSSKVSRADDVRHERQRYSEIRRPLQGSGPFAVENPIRRPEKRPCGGVSAISTGPQLRDAIAPLRHPVRISAPPGRFSVCRPHGLLQGFLRERPRAIPVALREFRHGSRSPRVGAMLR